MEPVPKERISLSASMLSSSGDWPGKPVSNLAAGDREYHSAGGQQTPWVQVRSWN